MAGSSTAGKVIPFPGAATAVPEELRAERPGANAPASFAGVSSRALATAVAIHVAAVSGLLAWPMSPPVLAPAIVVEVVAMAPPAPPQEPASAIEESQPLPPDPPPVPEPETASMPMPVEPVSEAIPESLPEPEPEPVPKPKPLALPRPATKPPPPRVAPPSARNPTPTQQAAAPPRPAAAPLAAPAAPSTPARERTGTASYTAVLLSWLERYRQYPRLARLKRIEGTVILSLTLSRSGSLKAISVKKGSGQSVLDDAAVDMARRADPFPPLPATFVHDRIEFVVPVVFALER